VAPAVKREAAAAALLLLRHEAQAVASVGKELQKQALRSTPLSAYCRYPAISYASRQSVVTYVA